LLFEAACSRKVTYSIQNFYLYILSWQNNDAGSMWTVETFHDYIPSFTTHQILLRISASLCGIIGKIKILHLKIKFYMKNVALFTH